MNLDGALWTKDTLLWRGLTFVLEDQRAGTPGPAGPHFRFYKNKALVGEFEAFFGQRPSLRAERILELGIFDGGSVAFWAEALDPQMLVAVDLATRGDSEYFRAYLTARKHRGTVATHWGVNQADQERLRAIVQRDFDGPLDLVIDDASHQYSQTKASFEACFPLIRPGGFYIIEDWSWHHWREYQAISPYRGRIPASRLIVELAEATGTRTGAIASITVQGTIAAVERGPAPLLSEPFRIEDHIFRDTAHYPHSLRTLSRTLWREVLARLRERTVRSR
jgi:predicted O-methyltransferase YrrM